MSNAQQVEQQQVQQQDAAAQSSQTPEPAFELRPDLKAQILGMSPGDAGPLAEMLKLYPNLSGRILLFAASHLGNAFVQRAIAVAKSSQTRGGAAPLRRGVVRDAIDGPGAPLSGSEMIAALHDESDGPAKTAPAAAPRAAPVAAPAWVAGARAYNAAHSERVDEFNELTSDVCRLDGEGKVDPQAVARWQSNHGLAADGKIGPHTVAAARKLKAKPPEVAAAPQADVRPPV
jgi:hypothetical protein